jgi:acetyltransferase-like isoleucine patch superfamily enzyme
MAFLNSNEISLMGFLSVGENVFISDRASFYNSANISLGNNVRIDDFCVLSAGEGGITIGSYVHVAVYTSLIGAGKITLSDFSNISSRVSIYSSNDDYSGDTMSNPMVPAGYKNVLDADVHIGKHVIIGSGSIVLPGITIEDGAVVGALSLVNRDCQAFGIYAGTPATFIKERKHHLLDLEKRFISDRG